MRRAAEAYLEIIDRRLGGRADDGIADDADIAGTTEFGGHFVVELLPVGHFPFDGGAHEPGFVIEAEHRGLHLGHGASHGQWIHPIALYLDGATLPRLYHDAAIVTAHLIGGRVVVGDTWVHVHRLVQIRDGLAHRCLAGGQ